MSIQELVKALPAPAKPVETGTEPEWDAVEESLGLTLPSDYKAFISRYGTGNVADFIHVYNPFAASPHTALLVRVEEICHLYRDYKESEGDAYVPFDVFPTDGGILPWGRDDNGNNLFWMTQGESGGWPVVVGDGRGPRWERFDVGVTSFLAKSLTSEISCSIWPDDFPGDDEIVFYPAKKKREAKK